MLVKELKVWKEQFICLAYLSEKLWTRVGDAGHAGGHPLQVQLQSSTSKLTGGAVGNVRLFTGDISSPPPGPLWRAAHTWHWPPSE